MLEDKIHLRDWKILMVYLTFPEILTLYLITQHFNVERVPPSWRRLTDLFNQWLETENPDRMYVKSPITGMRDLELYLKHLRDAGLLAKSGKLTTTEQGVLLAKALASDYRQWPVRLPVKNGEYNFDSAEYL